MKKLRVKTKDSMSNSISSAVRIGENEWVEKYQILLKDTNIDCVLTKTTEFYYKKVIGLTVSSLFSDSFSLPNTILGYLAKPQVK